MEDILFLVHRIPYPPNKGDKIRSFNILKWLASEYRVHLGCFIDEPEDRAYKEKLDQLCYNTKAIDISKQFSTVKSSLGLLRGEALTLPYYYRREMKNWVDETIINNKIKKVVVFSSSMAQYVDKARHAELYRVIDFVDVDSDKWRQYAESKKAPVSWVYQREYKLLRQYELEVTSRFDHATFVSDQESEFFQNFLPSCDVEKVSAIGNGVDTEFFNKEIIASNESLEGERYIVFTGAMDYWANADAAIWFCNNVWPLISEKLPELKLYIVGANPTGKVQELARNQRVVVTGRVEDIRPYIKQALVSVAPLLIARGIQNKVLEAMALEKPVVATPAAIEGITDATSKLAVSVEENPEKFASAVFDYCNAVINNNGQLRNETIANREFVLDVFSWQSQLSKLHSLLEKA